MEELYNELLERQEYLQSQEYSIEGKYRQRELNLMIVRVQQLLLHSVGNCKREDTLKHFKEMNELFLEAIIEVKNGIYDPVEEFGKDLADKYVIIKK